MTTTKKLTTLADALRMTGSNPTNLRAAAIFILVSDEGVALTASSIDPNTQVIEPLATVYASGDNGNIAATLTQMGTGRVNALIEEIDRSSGEGESCFNGSGPSVVALEQQDDGSLKNAVWDTLKNSISKH